MQRRSVHSVRCLSDLRQLHNNNQCICVHTLYITVHCIACILEKISCLQGLLDIYLSIM